MNLFMQLPAGKIKMKVVYLAIVTQRSPEVLIGRALHTETQIDLDVVAQARLKTRIVHLGMHLFSMSNVVTLNSKLKR